MWKTLSFAATIQNAFSRTLRTLHKTNLEHIYPCRQLCLTKPFQNVRPKGTNLTCACGWTVLAHAAAAQAGCSFFRLVQGRIKKGLNERVDGPKCAARIGTLYIAYNCVKLCELSQVGSIKTNGLFLRSLTVSLYWSGCDLLAHLCEEVIPRLSWPVGQATLTPCLLTSLLFVSVLSWIKMAAKYTRIVSVFPTFWCRDEDRLNILQIV